MCQKMQTYNLKQLSVYLVITFCILSCRTAEGQQCRKPPVRKGFLYPNQETYAHEMTVNYRCDKGYKPISEGWWNTITCQRGEWNPDPQCIVKSDCIFPEVRHATFDPENRFYSNGRHVYIRCNTGYLPQSSIRATCVNGTWTNLPDCKRNPDSCSAPPQVNYAVIDKEYRDVYPHNDYVYYYCKDSYELKGDYYSLCNRGTWTKPGFCVSKSATERPPLDGNSKDNGDRGTTNPGCLNVPEIANGDFIKQTGDTVTYQCARFYKLVGRPTITCKNGQWGEPPKCESNFCKVVGKVPHLQEQTLPKYISEGQQERFACADQYYYNYHYRPAWGICQKGVVHFDGCGYRWTFPSVQ